MTDNELTNYTVTHDTHGEDTHEHTPDGPTAYGTGCQTRGCDFTIILVDGPASDLEIVWGI